MILVQVNSIFGGTTVEFPDTVEGRVAAIAEAERVNATPDSAILGFSDCRWCEGDGHDAGRLCPTCRDRIEVAVAT